MKRYEVYVHIDSPWFYSIPGEWKQTRLKNLTTYISRGQTPLYTDDETCPKVINQAIFSRGFWNTKKIRYTVSESVNKANIAKAGDVLLASTGGGVLGKVFCFDQPDLYIADSHVTIIRTREQLSGRYLYYYLSVRYDAINALLSKGSTNQTELQEFPLKNIPVPVPPCAEQDQIVRYLDWQVSKINRLIAAKRKEIEVLKEQIQWIVASAVVGGIQPNVELKPVPMLHVNGIPSHWECKRGKYLFAEHDVRSVSGKEELLSVSHITGVTPRSQKNIPMFKSESLVNYKICNVNDVAANTMWMWQGAIAVSAYLGVISPSYNTYHQIADPYDAAYLDYLLRAKPLVDEYYVKSTGIRKSRLRLYPEQFLSMFFPVPPLEEQRQIVEAVREKTEAINAMISAIEQQIGQFVQLRTRLISDVVTGQIDVRGIEVPEFDLAEETDTCEENEEDTEGEEYEE